MGDHGDVDLLVRGDDYNGNFSTAVVEIKTHSGLIPNYERQLPKYQENFPDAKYYVGFLRDTDKEFRFDNFRFHRY